MKGRKVGEVGMTETDKLLVRIGTARDAISRKTKLTSLDYMIDGVLMNCSVLLKEQETKAGTWQGKIHGKAESGGTLGEAVCDQCGKSTYATAVKGDLNYCPNCGAKMTDRW
mgnify:CR=1 FL=1